MAFLPEAIWQRRLESEHRQMVESGEAFTASADKAEYRVDIVADGLALDSSDRVVQRREHKVRIRLLRNYPYAGGIDVTWMTPIFHPNIRNEDGKVCIQLLNNWAASQSVASLVQGLRQLLKNPNPADPLDKRAAEYFSQGAQAKQHAAAAFRQGGPRIVGW